MCLDKGLSNYSSKVPPRTLLKKKKERENIKPYRDHVFASLSVNRTGPGVQKGGVVLVDVENSIAQKEFIGITEMQRF